MKNKKGFTLVEVISVLAILAIIMLVAFPNFSSMINKSKTKYSGTARVMLKSAAKMYVNNNIAEVNTCISANSSNGCCIPIGKLIAYEYLDSDSDFKDSNGDKIPDNRCISVTKSTGSSGSEYIYDLDTERTATGDYYPPVLVLKKGANPADLDTVTAASLQEYESTYTVVANETLNADGIKKTITRGNNEKVLLIEYTATDTSGNKAIPLKVKLTLE